MSNCPTQPSITERVEALEPNQRRGDVRSIAAALPAIESAFAKGVSREMVHQALQAGGLRISFQGFVKALYRLRKKAKAAGDGPRRDDSKVRVAQSPTRPARVAPSPLQPGELRDIARNRPDLNELSRIAREATKAGKAVARVPESA